MGALRWLNLPPIWLALAMAGAWALAQISAPMGDGALWTGRGLIAAGLGLMVWSAVAFRRARTTLMPHMPPDALVATGPYRLSRNPIYLADMAILAGWCLALGTWLGLVMLVPLWAALTWLFILPEEARLEAHLGQPYRDYKARVRRWI